MAQRPAPAHPPRRWPPSATMKPAQAAAVSLVLLAIAAAMPGVRAAEGCGTAVLGSSMAARIATTACHENARWHSPFIDVDGRLASMTVVEAEVAPLTDGTPAWQRVAGYWRESGLLARMAAFDGASQCMAPAGAGSAVWCRSFVVDRPWSAAFVSWVMVRAGLPGFRPAASHVDYVRAAYRQAPASPYRFADPDVEPAAMGDLLCYVRVETRQYGHAGLRAFLDQPGESGLPMHCEVVAAADRNAGRLHLVGGNLLQAVTLRMIAIDRAGRPSALPRGAGRATGCWPGNPAACNFNRQDWAALLKLRPEHELALLAPSTASPAWQPTATQPQCCVYCVAGSGIPRCPKPGADVGTPDD
jgi:hypothetical protein